MADVQEQIELLQTEEAQIQEDVDVLMQQVSYLYMCKFNQT